MNTFVGRMYCTVEQFLEVNFGAYVASLQIACRLFFVMMLQSSMSRHTLLLLYTTVKHNEKHVYPPLSSCMIFGKDTFAPC